MQLNFPNIFKPCLNELTSGESSDIVVRLSVSLKTKQGQRLDHLVNRGIRQEVLELVCIDSDC